MKRTLLSLLGLIGLFAVLYPLVIRPWFLHWGATDAEWTRRLPGDEIVAAPLTQCTRAITVNAPPERVWPWLVQLGQGRGGFYSYTSLENLVGCQMVNADRIHPGWQNVKVGDGVLFHPTAPPVPVAVVEPNHAFVLGAASPAPNAPFSTVDWAFILEPVADGRTRMLFRWRASFEPTFTNYLTMKYLLEPIHFIMERRMMLTIKELAERPIS